MKDLLGVTSVTAPEGTGLPSSVLYADFNGPMVSDAWRIYNDVGAAIADQVMASSTLKTNFITCDPAASGCLMQTIQTFGRKAFRRPLTTDEVTRFMALGTGTPTGTPAEVAAATLYAFLVDPSFLYIEETNTTAAPASAPSGTLQLSSYEVAARLSYMIWGTTPDATLSTAADNNQLQTKAQILTQAKRMVGVAAKTAPQLVCVPRPLGADGQLGPALVAHRPRHQRVPALFGKRQAGLPGGDGQLLRDGCADRAGYKDLFLSNVGFVNKDTAPIYGLDASKYGTSLTQVQLDATQRPGFMTRARVPELVLALRRYVADPPRRLHRHLHAGGQPCPPPPGAAMTPQPPGDYKTNRDKVTALVQMSGTSCVGCHTNVINPSGFVLENYDGIGKWQTTDQLGWRDQRGGHRQLRRRQRPRTSPARCSSCRRSPPSPAGQATYAQYWISFAYGRDPNPQDQCVADQIATKLRRGVYPILNILSDLTQADAFRLRVRATP